LALVTACRPDQDPDPIYLDPGVRAVTEFGDLETGNVLGTVQDAAISPSGRYLAVLDRDDPHLRVLDREYDTAYVFGKEGEGPGEVKFPMSIAFLGDSVLAVLRSGAIDFFSPPGILRNTIQSSDLGIRAQAITDGCDALFIYGISGEEGRAAEPHWLHRVKVQSSPDRSVPFLSLGGRSAAKWGALEGLDGSDREIFLWHRPRNTEAGWVFDCEGETVRLLQSRESETEVRTALLEDGSGGAVFTLSDTLFSGSVVYGDVFLVAHTVRGENGEYGAGQTLLRSWAPEGRGCVTIPGWWWVFDAEAELVALATQEPFPRVLLIPFPALGGEDILGRPCG
jgi:hypothetical protein